MRVIVCGGRNYYQDRFVFGCLDMIHAKRPITMLVHGGADGADYVACLWAQSRRVPVTTFPVSKEEWTKLGEESISPRNKRMMDSGADLVVSFPGGRGTADMIGHARCAGVKVMAFG